MWQPHAAATGWGDKITQHVQYFLTEETWGRVAGIRSSGKIAMYTQWSQWSGEGSIFWGGVASTLPVTWICSSYVPVTCCKELFNFLHIRMRQGRNQVQPRDLGSQPRDLGSQVMGSGSANLDFESESFEGIGDPILLRFGGQGSEFWAK